MFKNKILIVYMKAGYRYNKKRSLRTISTKFVHKRIEKSKTKKLRTRNKTKRKGNKRRRTKKQRKSYRK